MAERIPGSCGKTSIAALTVFMVALTFYATPATAQGFSISFGDLEILASPGETVTTGFRISNQSEKPLVIRIYEGDWVRVRNGITHYEFASGESDEPRSFLEWLSFSPDQMELEPDESRDVLCEISVPDDPELSGSYWAVIFAEEVPPIGPDSEVPDDESMHIGVRTIFRYAVKIYVTIEGTESSSAAFSDLFIEQADSGFDITAVFTNNGNIFLRPETWLEIRDPSGMTIYRQDHILQTILPESSLAYNFEIRDLQLPPGTFLLMVLSNYGGASIVAAQGTMIISGETGESADE